MMTKLASSGVLLGVVGVFAVAGCKRASDKSPAEPILGCWKVTDSRDPRYSPGDGLCFLREGIVSSSDKSLGNEAFDVAWTASGDVFRALVPTTQTRGAPVEFSVVRAGEKLDFRAPNSSDWMTVRLGERSEPSGEDVLKSFHACRACIDDVVRARGKEGEPASPIYSLRSCTMFLRVTGAPCAALGMLGGQ